jgi:copper chaperone CopZ
LKRTFNLKGLGCANCAAKIEERVGKLDGVTSSIVNFATTRFIIEADEDKMPAIIEEAKKIIKKLEPDVVLESVVRV